MMEIRILDIKNSSLFTLPINLFPLNPKISNPIKTSHYLHQAPHSWGFLFVGGWVDLGDKRGDIHEKIKDVCDACIVFFDTYWWLFNFT